MSEAQESNYCYKTVVAQDGHRGVEQDCNDSNLTTADLLYMSGGQSGAHFCSRHVSVGRRDECNV